MFLATTVTSKKNLPIASVLLVVGNNLQQANSSKNNAENTDLSPKFYRFLKLNISNAIDNFAT
jgi:hypothetical protein